jgi:hypothetical protein
MNPSPSYDPMLFDLPTKRLALLQPVIGQKISRIFRIGPENPADEPGVMEQYPKDLGFNYYPGTLLFEFTSGYNLAISDDEQPCSLNVASLPMPVEDFDFSEAHVFEGKDLRFGNEHASGLIGEVIQRIDIIQGPPYSALFEALPRENVLRLLMKSGCEVFLTYNFLEIYHDVFLILDTILSDAERIRFHDHLKKSVLLQTIE